MVSAELRKWELRLKETIDSAERLEAEIILPQSSVKPEYKGAPKLLRWLTGGARTFRGPVVLGIREISRPLTFESSYTLIEHAGKDSIEMEIKPHALEQVRKLRAAVEERNFEELFRLLGTSETQRVYRADEEGEPADGEYTSVENTILEAVLKADPTGFLVSHPWVNAQLARRRPLRVVGPGLAPANVRNEPNLAKASRGQCAE